MAAASDITCVKTWGRAGLVHRPALCAEPQLCWGFTAPRCVLSLSSAGAAGRAFPPPAGRRAPFSLFPAPTAAPHPRGPVGTLSPTPGPGAAGRWLGRSRGPWSRRLGGPGLSLAWASGGVLTPALGLRRSLWTWLPPRSKRSALGCAVRCLNWETRDGSLPAETHWERGGRTAEPRAAGGPAPPRARGPSCGAAVFP